MNQFITLRAWVYVSTAVYILVAFGFVLLGILNANWLFKIPVLSNLLLLLPANIIDLPENEFGVHANQLVGTMFFLFPLFLGVILGLLMGRTSRKVLLGWLGLLGLAGFIILLMVGNCGNALFTECLLGNDFATDTSILALGLGGCWVNDC